MRKVILYIVLLINVLVIGSCDQPRFNFDVVIIPREVINFSSVNSRYDDYNSAGPMDEVVEPFTLFFSTNRNSSGGEFDIISYHCDMYARQVDGSFSIHAYPEETYLTDTINSPFNEWGPYITHDIYSMLYQDGPIDYIYEDTARIFFSSDREGDMDIYCWKYIRQRDPWIMYNPLNDIIEVGGLNTSSDEGYLCFQTDSLSDREICYFTSNRDGNFDIYQAVGDQGKRIEQTGSPAALKVEIISGSANDKCPYIINNMMVFTSNRDGGYGGYDLWYAMYEDGEWTAPKNFGPDINTEYDEYRPVIIPLKKNFFLNDLLIFSSDRPGGKGGFDLYYTGMDKMGSY